MADSQEGLYVATYGLAAGSSYAAAEPAAVFLLGGVSGEIISDFPIQNTCKMRQPGCMTLGNGHPATGYDLIVSDHNSNGPSSSSYCCNGIVVRI